MAKKKSISANIYSFKNKIHSGNSNLNDKIRIVLSYLIFKHKELFVEMKNSEKSIDPYIPLSKNLLIKLCGMKSNYLKVVKYLNENNIVKWYVSENSCSKRGFSYYNGYSRDNYNGCSPKETYCKKCRFTEIFWNSVKSGNIFSIECKIPESLMQSDAVIKGEFVSIRYEIDEEKENEREIHVERLKKQKDFLQKAFMNEPEKRKTNTSDVDLEELLGDLVVDAPMVIVDTETENLFSELEEMQSKIKTL